MKRLKDFIMSEENIYLAIYSVNSYVFDPELLSNEDKILLHSLSDPFNEKLIFNIINLVKENLKTILETDKLFKCQVYFKPKDYEEEEIKYRPIHSADLVTLISMVAMLNSLIYEIPDRFSQKLNLSNYSKLIPSNFYGNRISKEPENLFINWNIQYKKFTEKANEYYNTYYETKQYKYEVKLDIKNFFPSVNPLLVYQILVNNMPVSFINNRESDILKQVIYKLLVCEVTNLRNEYSKKIYYDSNNICSNYTLGIPQGLPQSYFFGNICMIEISKIYNKYFTGKSVYYVDDSYIYTNISIKNVSDFKDKLRSLNNEIVIMSREYIYEANKDSFINGKNVVDCIYLLQVHENDKSEYTDIEKLDYGERFLHNLSREASQVGVKIFATFSDEESVSIYNRTLGLLEAISDELKHSENKIYKEKLERYYKFFSYRALKLNLQIKDVLDRETIENVFPSCNPKNLFNTLPNEVDKEDFVNIYRHDIWQAAISILISNAPNDKHKKINKYIKCVIDAVYSYELLECSYLLRQYRDYINEEVIIDKTSIIYDTLNKMCNIRLLRLSNMNNNVLLNKFKKGVLVGINKSNILQSFGICSNEFNSMCKFVNLNTNRLIRMFLNAVYSKIFNITISDSLMINSQNREGITYGQLRTLVYLRSEDFVLHTFLNKNIDLNDDNNQIIIDYSLLEVLDIFKKFVIDSKYIDDLIIVHKYTSDVWKNGAKHLYFYTLHNQEHAVDMIKNIVKIVNAFSYIQISSYDYYLLFISCYLHDISMVRIASENDFLLDNDSSNRIVTQYSMLYAKKINLKKELVNIYKIIDEFYEKKIRGNHAKDSAEEIRTRKDLDFLDKSVRENVAEISMSHMMDTKDIYYTVGEAKDKLISMKFDKILLRFADLLDMSKRRVTMPILLHNLDNISEISAFHLISHALTNGYELQTSYKYVGDKDTICLRPGKIQEIVTLSIYVNLSQLSKIKLKNCKYGKVIERSFSSTEFELEMCNKDERCNSNLCNFLCAWFNKKNNYLIEEMNALESYLERIPDKERFYKTKIIIKILVQNPTNISDEQFEIIKKEIEK